MNYQNKFIYLSALFSAIFLLHACSNNPGDDRFAKTYALNAGDTLGESLKESGLSPENRIQITSNLSKIMPMNKCKPGDRYEIVFSSPAGYISFEYFSTGFDYYSVVKTSYGALAQKKTRRSEKRVASAAGSIETSLWESMTAKGIAPEVILSFADIFAWQIDFLTEPRKGDLYKLIYEQYAADDGTVKNGEIIAAQYTASGQTYTAMLFTDSKGRKDYFSPEGKSLESAFLKAPLQFRRISSHFSRRRFHPILKYFRPHLGIDYAAPSGTPVSSIGEGTVTFAGVKGGFGKYIAIRHSNGYASYYGHLLRFAKGVRRGNRIRQGQLIGYVGSTGLSSGPHLDFRVTKNGSFINFLRLKLPSARVIGEQDKEAFKALKKELFTRLSQTR